MDNIFYALHKFKISLNCYEIFTYSQLDEIMTSILKFHKKDSSLYALKEIILKGKNYQKKKVKFNSNIQYHYFSN